MGQVENVRHYGIIVGYNIRLECLFTGNYAGTNKSKTQLTFSKNNKRWKLVRNHRFALITSAKTAIIICKTGLSLKHNICFSISIYYSR